MNTKNAVSASGSSLSGESSRTHSIDTLSSRKLKAASDDSKNGIRSYELIRKASLLHEYLNSLEESIQQERKKQVCTTRELGHLTVSAELVHELCSLTSHVGEWAEFQGGVKSFADLDKRFEMSSRQYAGISRGIHILRYTLGKFASLVTSSYLISRYWKTDIECRRDCSRKLLRAIGQLPYVQPKALWVLLRFTLFMVSDTSKFNDCVLEGNRALRLVDADGQCPEGLLSDDGSKAVFQLTKQALFQFRSFYFVASSMSSKPHQTFQGLCGLLEGSSSEIPRVPVTTVVELLRHPFLNTPHEDAVALFVGSYIHQGKKQLGLSGQDINHLWSKVHWGWVQQCVSHLLRTDCSSSQNSAALSIENTHRQKLFQYIQQEWLKVSGDMPVSEEMRRHALGRDSYSFTISTTVKRHVLAKRLEYLCATSGIESFNLLDTFEEALSQAVQCAQITAPLSLPFSIWIDPNAPLADFDEIAMDSSFCWYQYAANPLPKHYARNVHLWAQVFSDATSVVPLYSGDDCLSAVRELSVRVYLPHLLKKYLQLAGDTATRNTWVRCVDVGRVAILCLRGGLYVDTDLQPRLPASFYKEVLFSSSDQSDTKQGKALTPFFLAPIDYTGMVQNHFVCCRPLHPIALMLLFLYAQSMTLVTESSNLADEESIADTLDSTGPLQLSRMANISMKLDAAADPVLQLSFGNNSGDICGAWKKLQDVRQHSLHQLRCDRLLLQAGLGFMGTPEFAPTQWVGWQTSNQLRTLLYLVPPALFYGKDNVLISTDKNIVTSLGIKFLVNLMQPQNVYKRKVSTTHSVGYGERDKPHEGMGASITDSGDSLDGMVSQNGRAHSSAPITMVYGSVRHGNRPMADHSWDRTWWPERSPDESLYTFGPYNFIYGPYTL
eukprot:gb/GECG01011784.1/.p1 GENE.gb/GECG01011784.1/~~gb/GECG01011784.1/.p1  ORF type:complete len:893 (+),score=80.48 gb/GECG01011784.1/:1-2679(+)